jgi:hypothetical protein
MTTLHELVAKLNTSEKALQNAVADNKAVLMSVSAALEPLYLEYVEWFKPLAEEADSLGLTIPEVSEEGFGRWGNMGLKCISDLKDGFACLTTMDYFRNETEVCEAYIPWRYLSEGGHELMRDDAVRVEAEFKAARDCQEAEAVVENEARERAELARLSSLYAC